MVHPRMTDKQEQIEVDELIGILTRCLITVYNSHFEEFGADQSTVHQADITMSPECEPLCIVLGSVGAAEPLQRAGRTSGSAHHVA